MDFVEEEAGLALLSSGFVGVMVADLWVPQRTAGNGNGADARPAHK